MDPAPDLLAATLSGINMLIAAAIWFQLGTIQGNQKQQNERIKALENRIGRAEERIH